MVQNDFLVATIVVDPPKNEPSEVSYGGTHPTKMYRRRTAIVWEWYNAFITAKTDPTNIWQHCILILGDGSKSGVAPVITGLCTKGNDLTRVAPAAQRFLRRTKTDPTTNGEGPDLNEGSKWRKAMNNLKQPF